MDMKDIIQEHQKYKNKTKNMNKIIKELIEGIPKNVMFDTHYIIRELRQKYADEYARFYKKKILSTHGRIGKEIAKFEGKLVEKQVYKSYSENIHKRSSRCALWRRV